LALLALYCKLACNSGMDVKLMSMLIVVRIYSLFLTQRMHWFTIAAFKKPWYKIQLSTIIYKTTRSNTDCSTTVYSKTTRSNTDHSTTIQLTITCSATVCSKTTRSSAHYSTTTQHTTTCSTAIQLNIIIRSNTDYDLAHY
jgi:hypothetical protein